MHREFKLLFSPIVVNHITFKNRIVMSPVGTNFASARGEVTQRLVDHYETRARGGAGMIIVEGTWVHPTGQAFIGQLGAYDDNLVQGLKTLAETIKAHGAACLLQLHHGGRHANPKITSSQPLAPSAIASPATRITPKEMSLDEIAMVIDAFVQAARRAKEAGFDGVEFHAAHDYLISEFLSPYTNKRQDAYGGSLKNRLRFLLEIVSASRDQLGPHFILSARMNGEDYVPEGLNIGETAQIAKILENEGLDLINVSGGVYVTPHMIISPLPMGPGVHLHLSAAVKQAVRIPVVGVGRITTPEFAEQALEDRKADLLALGRALLADPDWPQKAYEGRTADIRPCIGCNQGCIDHLLRQKPITCMVNAAVGRDRKYAVTKTDHPRTVVVIGGGPAGMEAARVAALRGHKVFLYEKAERLGGQIQLACVPPNKEAFKKIVDYLEGQLRKLKVTIYLGTEANRELVLKKHPDVVILATGAVPARPAISGLDGSRVLTAHDVLAGCAKTGQWIVVMGGGMTGCETAHYLAAQGKGVIIIEQLKWAGHDIGPARRLLLFKNLKEAGVNFITNAIVQCIDGDRLYYQKTTAESGEQNVLSGVDTLVNALGVRSFDPFSEELEQEVSRVEVIGDARSPGTCLNAIADGARVAHAL
ncbi:MAG: FAD-dependent oxidoreductase [Deltaproteobacteria bacterium]|nr:FAD-dependent oxidoreductase [Deltaproteobacteria bacterium]MBW2075033.1 FAD-dependent oxidoreductase [Deltaproteobacteria bacterium]